MLNLRKLTVWLAVILFSAGCSWNSGRVQLMSFNSWWGGTPDAVTVRKGDTLYSISRAYNIPIRDIIETNRLSPPYTLYVGQTLRMPTARVHTVVHGDTLYSISRLYNVDITTLSRLNNLREPYTLSIGQKLALPASVGSNSYAAASESKAPAAKTSTAATKTVKTAAAKKTTLVKKTSTTKTPSTYRKNKFAWPVRGTIISKFGAIGKGRSNDGINIKAPLGTTVKAADAGKVAYAGNELKGFGNLILIQHNDGWITAYAHNSSFLVKKGQWVAKGTPIAKVGSSGGVNTPQLHFEVRSGKKPLNPLTYLP